MKFRGMMIDNSAMKDFMSKLLEKLCFICNLIFNIILDVVNSLSKLGKDCIIRLSAKKVYFIISEEDSGPRHPLVWCELPVSFYFKEYNVVGVNENFNEIYLEFSTGTDF